jgi:Holliday junction resolvase RusA-like endonuclease
MNPPAPIPTDRSRKRKAAEATPLGRTEPWHAVIQGELASKANDRRLVPYKGRMLSIKSAKALAYNTALAWQVPRLEPMFEAELRLDVMVWYASRRPDLDISLLLDGLQGRVYRNDRQVRTQVIDHAIDRERPRVEITLSLRREKELPTPLEVFQERQASTP